MVNIKVSIIIKILSALINNISSDIKELIKESIDKLDLKAQATANPFDDLLVLLLRSIFY